MDEGLASLLDIANTLTGIALPFVVVFCVWIVKMLNKFQVHTAKVETTLDNMNLNIIGLKDALVGEATARGILAVQVGEVRERVGIIDSRLTTVERAVERRLPEREP